MKKIVAFILVLFIFPLANATFKSADETTQKLKSYKDFKRADAGSEEKAEAQEDQFFDDLSDAVNFAVSHKVNQDFLVTIARVTSLSLENDDTGYAGEVILPLFEKDKAAFRDALKKLSKKDADRIEESLKEKAREAKEGNG